MEQPRLEEMLSQSWERMTNSAVFVQLFTRAIHKDPLAMMQLGMAVTMDKPILIAAAPSLAMPENLRRVATEIVRTDATTTQVYQVFIRATPEQIWEAITTPEFTARYFQAIAGVWARRSSEVAQSVVIGLYPNWDISDAGVAAADEFLAAPASEVPPALRRLVLEGQAAVKRSLRARKFDTDGAT